MASLLKKEIMIPKKIHYCWFGRGPHSELMTRCIESWRRYLPDYEIVEWNEDNFDVNVCEYTRGAYAARKFAFVSDYARFWILHREGGLYFDTDVEVVRPMDDIVADGPFMGCEAEYREGRKAEELCVNPGLGLGAEPGMDFYATMLERYHAMSFVKPDGSLNLSTVVGYTTELLCERGLRATGDVQEVAGIKVYPKEYMCPLDYHTGEMRRTERTVSIHHYDSSWLSPLNKESVALDRKLQFIPKSQRRTVSKAIVLLKHGEWRKFFEGVKNKHFDI